MPFIFLHYEHIVLLYLRSEKGIPLGVLVLVVVLVTMVLQIPI